MASRKDKELLSIRAEMCTKANGTIIRRMDEASILIVKGPLIRENLGRICSMGLDPKLGQKEPSTKATTKTVKNTVKAITLGPMAPITKASGNRIE